MRSPQRRAAGLLLALSLTAVISCASNAPRHTSFPPSADLVAPPKPWLDPEAVAEAAAGDDTRLNLHNAALEAWGDGMAAQFSRVCHWAKDMAAKGLECPAP
jgi:hypothetical protein